MLPAGASGLSLEELQSEDAVRKFRAQAQASSEGDATAVAETVGPAASYDPSAENPSEAGTGATAEDAPTSDPSTEGEAAEDVSEDPELAAASAKYPEPPHSMSLDECRNALGANKKFFVKSRFAVCSGASFHQTWKRNEKPIGESEFRVFAIGTIAKGSREMHTQVYFANFAATGAMATHKLMISPILTMPKKWPASAKASQGGNVPGAQSFEALARQKPATFAHTITVASGQGSTRDDLVFAVYEPAVKIMPPPGWGMKGDQGGKLFFFAPRWDTAKYVTKKGGAVFSNVGTLRYSSKAGAPEKAVAEHIRDAYNNPGVTVPKNPQKSIPGRDVKNPLHRLFHDRTRREANRDEAIKVCKQVWGNNYPTDPQNPNVKRECDEFPFATTYEGSAQKRYEKSKPANNFSARALPRPDNGAGGTLLAGFLTKNRMIDGDNDGFIVEIQ